jgi:hypothetical protein
MHLRHYKTLFAKHKYSNAPSLDPAIPQDDEQAEEHNRQLAIKEEYDNMHQTLAWVHLSLLNYAYSYTRSQHIANTMIVFKDRGCVKIHRTRVIHIYEADLNLMLGLKWRVALYQSKALK